MTTPQPSRAPIEQFAAARHQIVQAHAQWKFFREIYDTSNDSVHVLNAVTGWGWATIHNLLVDSIILHITRLVDKRRGALSLGSIIRLVSPDKEIAKRLEKDLKKVADGVKILKFHRDNRVSHNNCECTLDPKKLPNLEVEQFETGLKSIGELMNTIGEQLDMEPYSEFEPVMEPAGTSIVMYLRFGLDAVKLGQQAVRGTISKEDLFDEIRKYA